jgi:hypothetical protein
MANLTKVEVEVTEQQATVVQITTPDADIYVNGVLVWQTYENPEFVKVPPILRAFAHAHSYYIKEERDGTITTDLNMKDFKTQATFYFPKNLRSAFCVRLDAFTNLEELEDEFIRNNTKIDEKTADILVAEFTAIWKGIMDSVAAANYKLAYSHNMNDKCWGWWDVLFKFEDWNQEAFIAIWKQFSDLNQRLDEVFKQYQM